MISSARFVFPNYVITWLNGQLTPKYSSLSLFPKLTPELIKELGLEKGVEGSMSAFLLEAEGKKALFDTGLNESMGSSIPDRLKELKVTPDEIDYIFITHFHRDHIGGLVDEKDEIYFKNAKIYGSREEYDGWINKMPADKNGLQVKTMKIIEKQIVKFNFNDTLPLGIKPVKAFGHTPGHTCYRKDDLLIIGDLIHGQDIQFKHPEICSQYDHDENASIDARKNILKYAEENKLFIAGMHLKYSNSSMYRDFYVKK